MRVLQRTIVLAVLLALGVALFYVGREHQIFLDNKICPGSSWARQRWACSCCSGSGHA